jgi:nucleolar complex protein 3
MSDNEIELSDQDLNILDEFETNFLLNVEKGNLNRRKEIPFTKLPIKNEKGILQRVKENSTIEEKTQLKMVKATMEPSMQVEEIVRETKVEDKEKNVSKKEKKPNLNKTSILEIKESLASTASALVQDPENEISQLKSLFDYVKDKRPLVVKLSLLTLLSVFKDIIPGYRIRKVPDAEKDVQISKQVRKLRNFEEALLSNYQNYLILLDVISKG